MQENELLTGLNDAQSEAVTTVNGPLLILDTSLAMRYSMIGLIGASSYWIGVCCQVGDIAAEREKRLKRFQVPTMIPRSLQ